ncbi:MAG: anhydro-N-acetylmuramic acid kinase [Nitrospirae bacterium]|nr:anhydro-N-acetylmuramic acid kinase [Candidatus Troglogloeales bacterium]
MKVIGLISGTSSDGIDAAIVEISRRGDLIRLIDFAIYPYPESLQQKLIALASGNPQSVADLCHLNFYLGERFADAAVQIAKKSDIPLSSVSLIGSHGQTVHHLPTPKKEGKWMIRSTLQIGEPSVIAERTGVTTIADFRPRDMAAFGEGAPLTPLLHYHLFGHRKKSRAIVNIGGISNVTYLKAGGDREDIRAFDMGPGNMLIDGLVHILTNKRIDLHGKIARRGKVILPLLSELMQHPFIRKKPPKSTGREVFGKAIIERLIHEKISHSSEDLIATATAFTAAAIGFNIRKFILEARPLWNDGPLTEVVVGGGGVRNNFLMESLAKNLSPIPVSPFETLGFDSRAIEAITFALLGYHTWHNQPANIPSVTGASGLVLLGKIIPGRYTPARATQSIDRAHLSV